MLFNYSYSASFSNLRVRFILATSLNSSLVSDTLRNFSWVFHYDGTTIIEARVEGGLPVET